MHSYRPITSKTPTTTIHGTVPHYSMKSVAYLLSVKLGLSDEKMLNHFPNKTIVVLYMNFDSEFKNIIASNTALTYMYKKFFEKPICNNTNQLISSHLAFMLVLYYFEEITTDLQKKCLSYVLNYHEHISKQRYDVSIYSKEYLLSEFTKHDKIITHYNIKSLFNTCNKYADALWRKYGRQYQMYKYTYNLEQIDLTEDELLILLRNALIKLKNCLINKITHAKLLHGYNDLTGLNKSIVSSIIDKTKSYIDIPSFYISKEEFEETKFELIWLSENYAF